MSYYADPEDAAISYASRIDELEAELGSRWEELEALRKLRELVADFVPVTEGQGAVAQAIRKQLLVLEAWK